MRSIALILILFLMTWQVTLTTASAAEWKQNTQYLPQYCKDRAKAVGGNLGEWEKWRGVFGELYIHMHHYCNGLYAETKAKTTLDRNERDKWLRSVKGEMAYVGKHCNSRCVLYPELHTRWGWALGKSGQFADAIQHLKMAINAKPKYSRAYSELSDVYVELNQINEARQVLEAGLKAKPGSRSLERRLKALE